MRKLIYLLALWAPMTSAQCDVELTNVNWNTGDIQIVVHNSDDCGIYWGVPWIDHLNIGVSNGVTVLNEYEFANFPLHSFLNFEEQDFGSGYGDYAFTGDTLNFNMADAQNANSSDTSNPLTVYERWMGYYSDGTFCEDAEIFIWQINYSNGPQALDPTWYNPFGTAPEYPDVNPWDNILPIDGLCPCDTIYIDVEVIEYLTDTITLVETIILVDTITITEYVTDTLIEYVDVILVDTIYNDVEVIVTEYIYQLDTITEFYTITEYIDCETGLPCDNGFNPCDETAIYAPNVVTPNGDGWNDTWQVISEGGCWDFWEVRIYNRWGGLVWISSSSTDEWDASVATGLYVYTIKASKNNPLEFYDFNGTVTVLY